MKNDISYILNNGGKINISSAGAAESENLNFKLQEENNLLRNQLKVAKDNLAELKEVIGTLESEKSTLISTVRILQRNDLSSVKKRHIILRLLGQQQKLSRHQKQSRKQVSLLLGLQRKPIKTAKRTRARRRTKKAMATEKIRKKSRNTARRIHC